MNRKNKAVLLAGTLLSLISLQGCIRDSLDHCPEESLVYVQVIDAETGADITAQGGVEDANIYVFDRESNFHSQYSLDAQQIKAGEPVVLRGKGIRGMNAVAWGNTTGGHTLCEADESHRPGTDLVSMNADGTGPGDLFFGQKTIGTGTKYVSVETIRITQKNARLYMTVRGLPQGAAAEDYYFRTEKPHSGYTYEGTPTGNEITVLSRGVLNDRNELVSGKACNMIHLAEDGSDAGQGSVRVKLFRRDAGGDNLVATAAEDVAGNEINLQSGKTTNILIRLTAGGDLQVYVELTPWNVVYRWDAW